MPSAQATSSGSTSTSLVARVQRGDGDAWKRLVQLYTPLLFQWSRRWSLRECDAADLTQEVFAAVAKSIGHFQRQSPGDSFAGWLYTIAYHAAQRLRRKQEHSPAAIGGTDFQAMLQQAPGVDSEASLAEPDLLSAESLLRRRALQLVREETPERQWQAFERLVISGDPAAQVAEEFGLSAEGVRQVKCRLLKKLRETLSGLRGLV